MIPFTIGLSADGKRREARVIPFPGDTAQRRARRPTPVGDGTDGRILLFTGIRYERMTDSLADPLVETVEPCRKRS